ncbi:acyl-homoserine-lactone synthase [Methylobacterium indicum]|nr:acyl-homoserine-lactone synthase [Methylobacterium indicum]
MFRARAVIFHERLGWAVAVRDGWETDRYDWHEDPVYAVTADAEHRLTGSLRVLPTTGETMLRTEFAGCRSTSRARPCGNARGSASIPAPARTRATRSVYRPSC